MIQAQEPNTVRVTGALGGPHPADGLTAEVKLGGGAAMTILNPQSFEDGGIEWHCRYGNFEGVRYSAASVIESYDYLLSNEITTGEAIKRLRDLRGARAYLARAAEPSA